MHKPTALRTTILLTSFLPISAQSFSIDEYRDSLVNVYREAFTGVCMPAEAELSPLDPELKPGAVGIEADQTEIIDANKIVFSGNAELERNGMIVSADKLSYDKSADTFAGDGNVRMQDPSGNVYKAESLDMEVETAIGTATNVTYELTSGLGDKSEPKKKKKKKDKKEKKLKQPKADKPLYIQAHGSAERVDFEGHDLTILHNATYSTCRKDKEIAVLNAKKIEIDQSAGVGKARNMKLRLFDVPVFWFPYVSFPLTDDRKSGFLMPSFGSSTRTGSFLKIPYYINIRPDMDATVSGNYYADRGFQLAGEYRYLTRGGNGTINGAYLADDKKTDENRYLYDVDLSQRFAQRWRASVQYSEVSDADYFEDFSGDLLQTSATYLRQEGRLNYDGSLVRASALYSDFQTVDETIPEEFRPYRREPAITFNTNIPKLEKFKFDVFGSYTDFQRDGRVSGPRTDLGGSVAYDFKKIYGFIKPKLTYRYTAYDLSNSLTGENSEPDRSLSIFSLDSGLYFDRFSTRNGKEYTTTLEPRLFYLYVPYEDQTDIPVFDTGSSTFSLGTMFRDNRFTGPDRIGDANQLTVALTSRYINEQTGNEILRGTIGQIYYFEDRRVSLSTTETEPDATSKSSFAGELYTRLNGKFYMYNFLQYDPEESEVSSFKSDVRYTRDARRAANLGYFYNNRNRQQANLDMTWALAPRWQLDANARYDLEKGDLLRSGVFVGYNACCWGMRFGAERRVDNTSEYVNSYIVEFELNGLTKIRSGF
jgi:LPS-assembly protein